MVKSLKTIFALNVGTNWNRFTILKLQNLIAKNVIPLSQKDPKVAAVVIVKKQDKILLVKRSIEPHLGKWSLLSGYVNRGES